MSSLNRSVCQQTGTTCAKRRGMTRGIRVFGWFLLAMAFLLMLPSRAAFAQYDTGSLIGVIQDSTGAVIPGVTVSAVNNATGVVYTGQSGSSGEYEIPNLHTGTYKVTAEHQGFSAAVADNVLVSVGIRQHIDLILKVGQTATTVEVSDVSLQVETEDSQRDQAITGYQTAALPLVSRNYTDLLALVSGVRQAPTQATTTSNINSPVRAGAYNVNGQRSVFNNFMLDGMDNNSYGESNQGFDNQIISVPPDSVDQFSVVTNNESAEYGRSSGATINVASLSGGNRFHAKLYEFFRNTDLNAPGFFKPLTVTTTGTVPFVKPPYHRNQYGGDFGGPILRDKMFFFLDYEGLRSIASPLFVLTLPTQNELNGNLVVPVHDPLTGTVYPAGSPIPSNAINPLSAQIVAAFENIKGLPTSGNASTGANSGDYAVFIPFRDYSDKGDLRLDYTASPSASYFLRISDRKETGINFPTIPLPLEGQTAGPQRILDQQIALGYTGTFGADKIIDVRLGISKTKAGKTPLSEGTAPVLVNGAPIPGLPTAPNIAGGLPAVSISGGFTAFGRQTTNPQFQNPALIDPKINYTWVRGKHSLKFGYEYEHIWMGVLDNNPLYGSFTYGGGYSTCPSALVGGVKTATLPNCPSITAVADNYFADFLFGTTSIYSLANVFEAHLRQSLDSAYAQDDWKVMPNLTLNLGLRWEYGSPYSDWKNYISNFDPVNQVVDTISPGAVSGNGIMPVTGSGVYGKTLVNPDLNDFAPRVGFAFAPTPKLSIRGGFGTSYVHYTRAGSGDIAAINAPQAQFASVSQISPSTTNHCSTPLPAQIISTTPPPPGQSPTPTCYATADQGFPSGLVTSFNYVTDNITWVPKNTRDSYVENFYLAVQRQITKNSLLDVAYVGNHGLKLQGFINGNQRNINVAQTTATTTVYSRPFANWPSDITEALNEFYSNYNALQVRYEQRMVGGLTLLDSFTWEHSLDNASASLEGNTPSVQDANHLSADYAQSDYNLPVANITSLVYDLPFGRGRTFGQSLNPIIDGILGGWQVSAIETLQAGTPFNLEYGPTNAQLASTQIPANQNYRGVNLYRPNKVPGVPLTQGRSVRVANSGAVQYVNFKAVQIPAIDNASGAVQPPFGNMSRNPGRTPALYQTDLDFNKTFNTPKEGLQIEFRSELYNIFNHTNLYLPATSNPDISGTQGSNASGGGQISSTFTPRVIQFALKVIY
jgi:Carboxypeptidase regulatory-like domain/TonB dependent receptor/TonB-dependent Receptor Plug Domain